MSMKRRSILAALFATCCCLVAVGPAASLNYPNRVIKMIVPFPPGGPIDTMARLVAHELSTRLGQEVVVENRPGAGSTLGTKAAASAEADGYTLLFGSSGSLAVAPALYAKLDIDPLKLFAPVASISLLPHVFVVAPSVPAKSVEEFVAYAKANPGKLNYGAGLGTPPHLLSTLLKVKAGIDASRSPARRRISPLSCKASCRNGPRSSNSQAQRRNETRAPRQPRWRVYRGPANKSRLHPERRNGHQIRPSHRSPSRPRRGQDQAQARSRSRQAPAPQPQGGVGAAPSARARLEHA